MYESNLKKVERTASAVRSIAWLGGIAWQDLKRRKEIFIVAPCVRIAIGLTQPNHNWLLRRTSQDRPNLVGRMPSDVSAQTNSISGFGTAAILLDRIISD